MSVIESARSFLFVPGNRPDRFAKAFASGSDAVILDLEDAVPPTEKGAARDAVRRWFEVCTGEQAERAVVRINGPGTRWHAADVEMFEGRALMVPKSRSGPEIARLAQAGPVLALIETAAGVLEAQALAAQANVRRLALGNFDLSSQLGIDPADGRALLGVRTMLVLASAAAGLPGPVDGVRGTLDDEVGLGEETEAARALGFTGKLCIHPRQVPVVNEGLAPAAVELAWARAVIEASEGGGVVEMNGEMIDKPVVDRARRLLVRAGENREEAS